MIKYIYDDKTEKIISDMKSILSEYTECLEKNLSSLPASRRHGLFYKDPTRNLILEKLTHIYNVSLPVKVILKGDLDKTFIIGEEISDE